MSNERPEAQSFNAAAKDAKDSIVESAKYAKDRVTAPASGEGQTDHDVKEVTKDKAEEAKEQGKGMLESISDGAKYVGSRFTASPAGENQTKQETKQASSWFGQAGDQAQEKKDKAGNVLEDKKNEAKDKYEDTQQTIADKISTNSVEEARAQGRIPADTETVKSVTK